MLLFVLGFSVVMVGLLDQVPLIALYNFTSIIPDHLLNSAIMHVRVLTWSQSDTSVCSMFTIESLALLNSSVRMVFLSWQPICFKVCFLQRFIPFYASVKFIWKFSYVFSPSGQSSHFFAVLCKYPSLVDDGLELRHYSVFIDGAFCIRQEFTEFKGTINEFCKGPVGVPQLFQAFPIIG